MNVVRHYQKNSKTMCRKIHKMTRNTYIPAITLVITVLLTSCHGRENEKNNEPKRDVVSNSISAKLEYRDPKDVCPFTLEIYPEKVLAGDPVYVRITFENTTDSYAWVPANDLVFDTLGNVVSYFKQDSGRTLPWCSHAWEGELMISRPLPWRKIQPGEKVVHSHVATIPKYWNFYEKGYQIQENDYGYGTEKKGKPAWYDVMKNGAQGSLELMVRTIPGDVDIDMWKQMQERLYAEEYTIIIRVLQSTFLSFPELPQLVHIATTPRDHEAWDYLQKVNPHELLGKARTVISDQKITLLPRSQSHWDAVMKYCNSPDFQNAMHGIHAKIQILEELSQLIKKTPEGTLRNRLLFYHRYLIVLYSLMHNASPETYPRYPVPVVRDLKSVLDSFGEIEREYYMKTFIPNLEVIVKRKILLAEDAIKELHDKFPEKVSGGVKDGSPEISWMHKQFQMDSR